MKKPRPDYRLIYTDILNKKYPHKKEACIKLLKKNNFSVLNIIELNIIIFGQDKQSQNFNQKHRSYQKSDILKILDYQKNHRLSNSQLAMHFKLSRNTAAKWKKMFLS